MKRRFVGAAAASLAVLGLLSGCGVLFPSPGTFKDLDSTVERLDLKSVGTVETDKHFGGTRLGPAYVLDVVSGARAREKLDATLSDEGFTSYQSSDGDPVDWDSPSTWPSVSVEVRSVTAGDRLEDGSDSRYKIKGDGVALYVTQ